MKTNAMFWLGRDADPDDGCHVEIVETIPETEGGFRPIEWSEFTTAHETAGEKIKGRRMYCLTGVGDLRVESELVTEDDPPTRYYSCRADDGKRYAIRETPIENGYEKWDEELDDD